MNNQLCRVDIVGQLITSFTLQHSPLHSLPPGNNPSLPTHSTIEGPWINDHINLPKHHGH
ncbi:hypothetical protein J6590_020576 [Homalodisca vitripennis]|nr:hypothetical protein J6590_020576 [Homalodisca vitripennis]